MEIEDEAVGNAVVSLIDSVVGTIDGKRLVPSEVFVFGLIDGAELVATLLVGTAINVGRAVGCDVVTGTTVGDDTVEFAAGYTKTT